MLQHLNSIDSSYDDDIKDSVAYHHVKSSGGGDLFVTSDTTTTAATSSTQIQSSSSVLDSTSTSPLVITTATTTTTTNNNTGCSNDTTSTNNNITNNDNVVAVGDNSDLIKTPSRTPKQSSPSSLSSSQSSYSSSEKRKSRRVQSGGGHNIYQSELKKEPKREAKKVGDFLLFTKSELGSGSYATVYEGIHQDTHEKVAIKVIQKRRLNNLSSKYLKSEIKIMRELDSNYCIRMIDDLETTNNFYLVLEYCGGGDLNGMMSKKSPLVFDKKGRMKERFLKKMIYQLSEGWKYLHDKKIMHRDLKLANILFSKAMEIIKFGDGEEDYDIDFGYLKLADLGMAKELGSDMLAQTYCGTPLYMAPEVMFNGSGKLLGYDEKADLWSIGVIIYHLCYGCLPFFAGSIHQMMDLMHRGASFATDNISCDLIDFLKGLLQYDPITRFNFEQFYTHPYLVNIRKEMKQENGQEIIELSLDDEYDIIDPTELQNIPVTPLVDDHSPTTTTDNGSSSSSIQNDSSTTTTQSTNVVESRNYITIFDEKMEFNPETLKNYSIQSSIDFYPTVTFDFSELASLENDKTILNIVEVYLKMSWAIAEMALNFEKSLKLTESFALYLRASQLLQNSTDHLSQLPTSERETALSTFIDYLLMDLFKRMEKLHPQIKHLNPSKSKDIINAMYLSAIEITKEACCWEMIGYSKWNGLYNRAFYLLSYLSELTKDNEEDHKKISHLAKVIQIKLNKKQ